MSRLIDADFACKGCVRYRTSLPCEECVVKAAPTVDAVPVVRCWECKWWQEDDDIGHCDNPDGLDNYAKPEDFCSYGERKEGAE